MGWFSFSRVLGKEHVTGIRVAGVELEGYEAWARMCNDYVACGNGNPNLIEFWKGFGNMLYDCKTVDVDPALSRFLNLSCGNAAVAPPLAPAPSTPKVVDPATPKVIDPAPLTSSLIIKAEPVTPTAAKSAPAVPPSFRTRNFEEADLAESESSLSAFILQTARPKKAAKPNALE
jgi:hypothetical protein